MYITNLDEVVSLLRGRLRDYLVLKLGIRANARKLNCFVHDDNDPSMYFNPKANDETVKCFSCQWSGDIFAAAEELENLPASGSEWVIETIPTLAKTLDIPVKLGDPSPLDRERASLYKLTQDITDLMMSKEEDNPAKQYAEARGWLQDDLPIGSIDEDELVSKLVERGWDPNELNRSLLIRTKYHSYFSEDKITFVIQDHRSRPIGFVSRTINDDKPSKYINTPENTIYEKSKTLLGINKAIETAKKDGLYIVEGPGDLAQLYRLGITNAVATCGTSFTEHHLLLLKSLGIRKVFLNFDWDSPGYVATSRVLENILKATHNISSYVVLPPSESYENCNQAYKDPDELLRETKDPEAYLNLIKQSAFEWQLSQGSDNEPPDILCGRMIPTVACEEAAVKREMLIATLAEYTGISAQAIATDINVLRNNKFNERKEKLVTSAEQYLQEVQEDPNNIMAHMSQHEARVENIEKEFKRNTVGVNYQLARYEAIQEQRNNVDADESMSTFNMNYFHSFQNALSGGMNWASGCLIYVGGRSNSGKTAVVLALACDVALSDPNAMVILHSTDDSYEQIEPRLKTSIYRMICGDEPKLTIGMVVQPHIYLKPKTPDYHEAYKLADEALKDLLNEERLIVIDAEDGSTLTVLERNIRHYRQRFPERKLLVVCDNTHNYMDFAHLDQKTRMTMISNQQKQISAKYHACIMATAEYRKNMPMDQSKFKLPVDDDLADARSLMYRPNVIFHVYNDMHDRKEYAEIFWKDEDGKMNPRLLLHFTKNKISGFKEKLIFDLDPKTVTVKPKSTKDAQVEIEEFRNLKESGEVVTKGNSLIYVKASEYTADAN